VSGTKAGALTGDLLWAVGRRRHYVKSIYRQVDGRWIRVEYIFTFRGESPIWSGSGRWPMHIRDLRVLKRGCCSYRAGTEWVLLLNGAL
jgi:hypothetical protein